MGTISYVERNPERWKIFDEGLSLKSSKEPIVLVEYGTDNDEYSGDAALSIYMRKSIVQKILKKTYHAEYNHDYTLRVYDENNNIVPPIEIDVVY